MQETFGGQPAGWAREEALLSRAVSEINRLRPAFAIVCGDLVHDYPSADGEESLSRLQQTFDFQLACEQVDPAIPLVCVCGNHDVGNRPTPASLRAYTRAFGDDYFAFVLDGVKCVVLNSQLLKDGSAAADAANKQWRWLEEELNADDTKAARHVLAFCHIPPFVFDPHEPHAYFNLETAVRQRLLGLLAAHGVRACFCGHFHRNAGGMYSGGAGSRDVEVVVTGACGVNVGYSPEGDPLEINGMGGPREVSEHVSGMRLVCLGEEAITHSWYTFSELAATCGDALAGAASSDVALRPVPPPQKKRKRASEPYRTS